MLVSGAVSDDFEVFKVWFDLVKLTLSDVGM